MSLEDAPQIYRYPFGFRAFFVGGTVFFIGLATWNALDVNNPTASPWIVLLFLGFATLTGIFVWRATAQIAVDAKGISWHRMGCRDRRLGWEQIRCIRENHNWQVLELHGDSAVPAVFVDYLLQEFSQLRELIQANASGARLGPEDEVRRPPMLPATFRRSSLPYLCMACVVLALPGALAFWITGWIWVALSCLAIGGLAVEAVRTSWHTLVVDSDGLVLRGVVRERRIPLETIASVQAQDVIPDLHGVPLGVVITLIVHLRSGKKLYLGTFKDQTLYVREVIQFALSCPENRSQRRSPSA